MSEEKDVCKPQFFHPSKVKELLYYDETKIHVSKFAQCKFNEYVDNAIKDGILEIERNLPRNKKGGLKRISIHPEDVPIKIHGKYDEDLIAFSRTKPFFYEYDVTEKGSERVQLRISTEARPLVKEYLNFKIDQSVKKLIHKLPFKERNNEKIIKRVTIVEEDFE